MTVAEIDTSDGNSFRLGAYCGHICGTVDHVHVESRLIWAGSE